MKTARSTTSTRQPDRTAIVVFLAATAVMLAGSWWMQDGQPGIATLAGILSNQP